MSGNVKFFPILCIPHGIFQSTDGKFLTAVILKPLYLTVLHIFFNYFGLQIAWQSMRKNFENQNPEIKKNMPARFKSPLRILFPLLILCFSINVFAQGTTGRLEGTIFDAA